MTVEVGDRAPRFELPADNWEKKVSLEDLTVEGPVALFFYPGDWSSVCTDQMSKLQAELGEFEERGVTVAAVSVDSPWSHRAFAEDRGISFPPLSDFGREVVESYGVQHDAGFPLRAYFIIDGEGVVRARRVEPTPGQQPDVEEVLEDLDGVLRG